MKRVVEIPNDIKSVTTVPEWQLNFPWWKNLCTRRNDKQALRS